MCMAVPLWTSWVASSTPSDWPQKPTLFFTERQTSCKQALCKQVGRYFQNFYSTHTHTHRAAVWPTKCDKWQGHTNYGTSTGLILVLNLTQYSNVSTGKICMSVKTCHKQRISQTGLYVLWTSRLKVTQVPNGYPVDQVTPNRFQWK